MPDAIHDVPLSGVNVFLKLVFLAVKSLRQSGPLSIQAGSFLIAERRLPCVQPLLQIINLLV